MGYGTYSDTAYKGFVSSKLKSHGTAFAYDSDVKTGKAVFEVHQSLNPLRVTRESKDSPEHPRSNAIIVGLDVTGSMYTVLQAIHKDLSTLMTLLQDKKYIPDPQVLVAAVGDATTDHVPLQVGQFESDARVEQHLGNMVLEGGGGGQLTESYELLAYFVAHKMAIDCFEKRGRKGFCFLIGDEMPYPKVSRHQVQALIGDTPQVSVETKDIFAKLKEKFHVFFLLPSAASHGNDAEVASVWKQLVGPDNVLTLERADTAAAVIAVTVGLTEGTITPKQVKADLHNLPEADVVIRTTRRIRFEKAEKAE